MRKLGGHKMKVCKYLNILKIYAVFHMVLKTQKQSVITALILQKSMVLSIFRMK